MSSLQRLISPLRQAAAVFFRQDLVVRRDGREVRLVLEERPRARPQQAGRVEELQRKESAELAQMRAELAALLNELPGTRHALRHLVFVEQALARKGLKALHQVPLDVLQRALEQLEGLVVNWSPVGLANLRSKMAVAIIEREQLDQDDAGDASRVGKALDERAVTTIVMETTLAEALPEAQECSDEEALAAAYAALGALMPTAPEGEGAASSAEAAPGAEDPPAPGVPMPGVQMQGELGSGSAKAVQRAQNAAQPHAPAPPLRMRELQN